MEEKIQSHSLCLEEQKKLTVNGVMSVDSFSEQSITATLIRNKLTIGGEGLKIVAFSKNTGVLNVDGTVYSLKYGKPKVSLIKRLTK